MSGRWKIAGAAMAAVALAGAVVFGGVKLTQAQSPSPTPQAQKAGLLADAEQKLAANLGISVDQLRQALKETGTQLVDEAVAQGKLTQQQGDALKQRIEQAQDPLGALFRLRGPRAGHVRAVLGERLVLQAAADTLGMQPADLAKELRADGGKSLADVAQAHNTSVDDLKAGIISHATDALNKAVDNGKITREQADQAIQRLKDNIDTVVNKKPAGCGRGVWRKGPFAIPAPSGTPSAGQGSRFFRPLGRGLGNRF